MMVLIVLGKMKEILQVVHVTLSASQTGSSLLYCQLNWMGLSFPLALRPTFF